MSTFPPNFVPLVNFFARVDWTLGELTSSPPGYLAPVLVALLPQVSTNVTNFFVLNMATPSRSVPDGPSLSQNFTAMPVGSSSMVQIWSQI